MIKSLPDQLPSEILKEFSMGNHEADRDALLDNCFCNIAPVTQFLRGDKDYLIGVKGSGKSAVFRQLVREKIRFENKKRLSQIIVPINQDIDYLSVKSHLTLSLESAITDEDLRARFIWEIYILYRICRSLNDSNIDLGSEAREQIKNVIDHFSFETKTPSIVEIFTKANRTIGCKIDTQTGIPVPDFYLKTEPKPLSRPDSGDIKKITINISDILSTLNTALRRHHAIVYVLIDNLDDFLAREAYDAQRLVIQGLLGCSKNYSRLAYVRVRLFLRNEVFHKADFEVIGGAEKIAPNAIYLEWEPSDIRRLIAERFMFNFLSALHLEKIEIEVNEDRFMRRLKPIWMPPLLWRWVSRDETRNAMDVTDMDMVWRTVITSILPPTVRHYTIKGDIEEGLDLFEYIDSHFSLANSKATPRAMIIYIEKLISISDRYYAELLYPLIKKNEHGEFPLFLRDHLQQAYQELQQELSSYIASSVTHPEWKPRIESLMTNINRKTQFTFRELKRLIDYSDQDTDAKQLLAFLEHLGVLVCNNKSVHLPDRKYEIPILLQKI